MASLEGRIALVTGASRGIGRAIALELARAGAKVALNYRTGESEARSLAEEIGALQTAGAAASTAQPHARAVADAVEARSGATTGTKTAGVESEKADNVLLAKANVASPEEARDLVRRVVDRWGRLDILVNNAGITRDRTLRKMTDEEWEAVIATNLNSAFYCTSAAVPSMIEQKYGRIVNIASVIGQAGNIGQANYSASKAGMIALTKSTAQELARYGITANTVCPGFIATEMVTRIPEEIQDQIKGKIPLGRFGEASEIARAVIFLVADGDYITGQQINVNGGIYM